MMKTEKQRTKEKELLKKVEEDSATDARRGNLYVHVLDATCTRAVDPYAVIFMGTKGVRFNHAAAGVLRHATSQPKFGGVAKWIDPPEKFSIRVELWDRHVLGEDKILGMAEISGLAPELTSKWHTAAAKIGDVGTLNVRLYYKQAGHAGPTQNDLFELAEDTLDPIPDEEGDALTSIGTNAFELRNHVNKFTGLARHVTKVIMWRSTPRAESALIMFGTIFFAWKNMLLPGLFLGLWLTCVAFYMRSRTGLDDRSEVLAQRRLKEEERQRVEEKKREVEPNVKTKMRLGVAALHDFNALMATAQRAITIDSTQKLAIGAGGCLGAAVLLFFTPVRALLRFALILGTIYLFTVQSLYMNFPNLKKRYFWPDLAMKYALVLRAKLPPKLQGYLQFGSKTNVTKSVPDPVADAVQQRAPSTSYHELAAAAAAHTETSPAATTTASTTGMGVLDVNKMSEQETMRALAADLGAQPGIATAQPASTLRRRSVGANAATLLEPTVASAAAIPITRTVSDSRSTGPRINVAEKLQQNRAGGFGESAPFVMDSATTIAPTATVLQPALGVVESAAPPVTGTVPLSPNALPSEKKVMEHQESTTAQRRGSLEVLREKMHDARSKLHEAREYVREKAIDTKERLRHGMSKSPTNRGYSTLDATEEPVSVALVEGAQSVVVPETRTLTPTAPALAPVPPVAPMAATQPAAIAPAVVETAPTISAAPVVAQQSAIPAATIATAAPTIAAQAPAATMASAPVSAEPLTATHAAPSISATEAAQIGQNIAATLGIQPVQNTNFLSSNVGAATAGLGTARTQGESPIIPGDALAQRVDQGLPETMRPVPSFPLGRDPVQARLEAQRDAHDLQEAKKQDVVTSMNLQDLSRNINISPSPPSAVSVSGGANVVPAGTQPYQPQFAKLQQLSPNTALDYFDPSMNGEPLVLPHADPVTNPLSESRSQQERGGYGSIPGKPYGA